MKIRNLLVLLVLLALAACNNTPTTGTQTEPTATTVTETEVEPTAATEGETEATATTPAETQATATTEQAAQEPVGDGTPLRLGLLPVTDVIPFYVAQQLGYFEEEGVTVELIPVASAADRDTFIQAGEIDGQLNDLISTVLTNAGEGTQIRVVRQARTAFEDQAQYFILSAPRSNITIPSDLKGKEIAISENSSIEYVTDRLLQMEGFTEEEIVTTNVPQIPTRLQLLLEGQVSAATLPDPLASLAVLQGATVVLSDAAHPEVTQSVISFRADVLESRPDDVAAVLRAFDRAVQAINENPAAFQDVLIAQSRVPEPLLGQYQLPRFPEGGFPTEEQLADVVDWAMEKGLISEPLAYDELVDTSFMDE